MSSFPEFSVFVEYWGERYIFNGGKKIPIFNRDHFLEFVIKFAHGGSGLLGFLEGDPQLWMISFVSI